MDTFLYPLLASSYAAISDLHAACLIYTFIQQFHTADMDNKKGVAAQDQIHHFSTATSQGHDMHQVNGKKDRFKLQQNVQVCAVQCLGPSSAAVLFQ